MGFAKSFSCQTQSLCCVGVRVGVLTKDKVFHIYRHHKVRKYDICGTTRTSLEFLNNHISIKHKDGADVVDAPQEVTIELLKPDCNGMFTIHHLLCYGFKVSNLTARIQKELWVKFRDM